MEAALFLNIEKKTVLSVMGKNIFYRKSEKNVLVEMVRDLSLRMVKLFMWIVPDVVEKGISLVIYKSPVLTVEVEDMWLSGSHIRKNVMLVMGKGMFL